MKEELPSLAVVAKFATTARDGKTYTMEYYNLYIDVNQFRI